VTAFTIDTVERFRWIGAFRMTPADVVEYLRRYRFSCATEDELQRGIALATAKMGLAVTNWHAISE
jgi:hypothetical protein